VSGLELLRIAKEKNPFTEVIIVTGTRIARPVDEATGPVTVVSSSDQKRTAADSIGKILQSLPLQTGATINTQVNNGGDGTFTVVVTAVVKEARRLAG